VRRKLVREAGADGRDRRVFADDEALELPGDPGADAVVEVDPARINLSTGESEPLQAAMRSGPPPPHVPRSNPARAAERRGEER
jgi:hypothetical protein